MKKPKIETIKYIDWMDVEQYIYKNYSDKFTHDDISRFFFDLTFEDSMGNDKYYKAWTEGDYICWKHHPKIHEFLKIFRKEFKDAIDENQMTLLWVSW